MKNLKRLLNYLGYEVTAKRRGSANGLSIYRVALTALLSGTDKLRIVQVGANDGAVHDPVYTFVRDFRERTEILLIEPQENLLPYLKQNYHFHAAHTIYNGAVGPEGSLRLYTVAPEFWKDLNVPYANGWPEYRAPSGVTSASRDHVYAWLRTYMKDTSNIDQAIREISVASLPLPGILAKSSFQSPVDCLQIDAEGFDDQIIYNCDIKQTMPRLIHFEAAHLNSERYDELNRFLYEHHYHVWRNGNDALAVSVESRTG